MYPRLKKGFLEKVAPLDLSDRLVTAEAVQEKDKTMFLRKEGFLEKLAPLDLEDRLVTATAVQE
jgi:hypothetical protein